MSVTSTTRTRTGLAELLERQVAERPHACALVEEDRSWTYAELGERVAALRGLLRARGVGPDDRLALLAGRSAEVVAWIWAALGRGAAFSMRDPESGPAELACWLADLAPAAVVVDDRWLERRPPLRQVVGPYRSLGIHDVRRSGAPPLEVDPDAAAYVYYTSGSTGEPRGAVVAHAAVQSAVEGFIELLELGREDRLLNTVPLHLDRGVFEVVGTVAAGASSVLVRSGAPLPRFLGAVEHHRVTLLSTAPGTLRTLAIGGSRFDRWNLRSVRTLLFGGEPCEARTLGPVAARIPGVRFCSGYGTTEAVMQSAMYRTRELGELGGSWFPIGAAFPDSHLHVVDEAGRPLPDGSIGEIAISGRFMAGYWRRPEQTRQRLRALGPPHEQTLACFTGDLGRVDERGLVHFVGRRDNEFKLRGERIHLEQIESAIAGLDGVRDAACATSTEPCGATRLVAFVQTAPGVTEVALRNALVARVSPAWMPHQWLQVDRVPRTAAGKLDRQSLRGLPPPTGEVNAQPAESLLEAASP